LEALLSAGRGLVIEALLYEQLFYAYIGATLVVGLYLTYAGFSARLNLGD